LQVERAFVAANAVEMGRLRALAGRLSDTDLATSMPAGWTVAAVLAHAGFWDARALYWLDRWDAGLEPSPPDFESREDVEWINNAAKPLCLALPSREAAQLALRLAEETDRRIAALPNELLERVLAAGAPFNLSRAEHRREHLDDIERALAGR
jgi:hypothetical protein